jgi:hypothetical protein
VAIADTRLIREPGNVLSVAGVLVSVMMFAYEVAVEEGFETEIFVDVVDHFLPGTS